MHSDEFTLAEALRAALPAECQRIFTLRKVYGYSQREIAARLRIPESAVEEQLVQAVWYCAEASNGYGSTLRRSLLERLLRRLSP